MTRNPKSSFTTAFSVPQSPDEVFRAINNVRAWWSPVIDGDTDSLGATWDYAYLDVHRCRLKITALDPGKKIAWHVVENHFNFVKDKAEWTGTDIVFDITAKPDGTTELRFTHVGLVPSYECYDVCRDAWSTYINGSLRELITTGKGRPVTVEDVAARARQMSETPFTTSFVVDQSPDEVFAAINNVRGWWSEQVEGRTDAPGAAFAYHFKDIHRSTQQIREMVPGKRVAWRVTESQLNFVDDKTEWNDTDIVFEIERKGDKTELRFTHVGLVPAIQCYSDCSTAWGFYINDSLRGLITAGRGQPDRKE
jgi:hypothetical protein